jgi:predicted ATPase
MNAVKVPATVQAVLASRIDRLSAEEKELLQTLAVLGREFRLGLVQRVTLKPVLAQAPAQPGVVSAPGLIAQGRTCRSIVPPDRPPSS